MKRFLARLAGAMGVAVGTVVATSALAAQDTAPKIDMAAGEALFSSTCASCHGVDGNSTIAENPKLAGQHPAYLLKQLQEFKNKKRANPVMAGFAANLSDADRRNVAAWVSKQKPKTGFSKVPDTVFLGERIYRGGLADRQIAACAGCHSPNGAGIPNAYPRLSGQQALYTENQLRAFRDDVRQNSKVMREVAAKLNDREIKAVADYIAGLR